MMHSIDQTHLWIELLVLYDPHLWLCYVCVKYCWYRMSITMADWIRQWVSGGI